MKKRTIIDLVLLFAVGVVGFLAIRNAHLIGDWMYFRSYEPSEQVTKLADDAGMSDYGRRLFYRLDPQFVDRHVINKNCGTDALGCTVGRHIFILNDFTDSQYNRSVVTAAHEMLHVAWSRMSKASRIALETDINMQITMTDKDLLNKFSKFGGEDYYNEAHSYLGSEHGRLTGKLSEHYDQYFIDRGKVLEALNRSPEGY